MVNKRPTSERSSCIPEIIRHVADQESIPEADLPPLYDCIDPDALERLLGRSNPSDTVTVSFSYCGYQIEAHSDGRVYVCGDLIKRMDGQFVAGDAEDRSAEI